ncbi:hypothetical protein CEQ90_08570 [Lewinellaceae bacterium SD302]|nr:hypothetical protein CEQ90_08570 [Lewinellaceae bacterium SD302]
MIKVTSFLTVILLLTTCASRVISNDKGQITAYPCQNQLDTFVQVTRHLRFGVYEVDLDFFSIEKYKRMSILDLNAKGLPYSEVAQKALEFKSFLKRLLNSSDCVYNMGPAKFQEIVGPAYDINRVGVMTYRFNLGPNCPYCDGDIGRIFEHCSSMQISFDERRKYQFVNIIQADNYP